ncbi:MAG: hypothetical protein D3909_15590 [Candidatus Electrothrix sp. ATG1]|nr:hypothetical protein [Candidatus Electrothrix sp. ATG1]
MSRNHALFIKNYFSKKHWLKTDKKRGSSNLKFANLKMEFFQDQCSIEEYETVFPAPHFIRNTGKNTTSI